MKGIFNWLKSGSKMKRWILLILVGVVFASFGMANILTSNESITILQAVEIFELTKYDDCVILNPEKIHKRMLQSRKNRHYCDADAGIHDTFSSADTCRDNGRG